ncbi:MAG: DUF3419 family protein [Planctomycetota bacterium]
MKESGDGLVERAVQTQPLASRQGIMQRLFSVWFDSFVYNQIWEDPRVDLEALRMDSNSRVMAIASGGCNVLSYLVEEPARVVALDINRYHIYLTRLKLAALRNLPDYESFFSFFGCADTKENLLKYRAFVREHLDPEARKYWEGANWWRRFVVGPPINYFANNFYNYAKLGKLLRLVHFLGRVTRSNHLKILKARSLEEQQTVFHETISPFFEHRLVRLVVRQPFVMYSLGIPPQQYALVSHENAGDVVALYHERLRRLMCDFPVQDNYFAWQALSRGYDRTDRRAIPEYLRECNYTTLKSCADRVETYIQPMTQFLREQPPGSLNRFVLLDAQDWMTREQIAELWTEILRVGGPGARIVFRTGGAQSVVENALPADLRARFDYEVDLSRDLHRKDRSGIYGGFHVYSIPDRSGSN